MILRLRRVTQVWLTERGDERSDEPAEAADDRSSERMAGKPDAVYAEKSGLTGGYEESARRRQTSLFRTAQTAACVRSATPILRKMC